MKSVKKKSAKSKPRKPLPNRKALLQDLDSLAEMAKVSGRKWESSVVRDAIRFVRAK